MLLYIQITGKVIQKILKLFNLQRSVFTMLKKIVSGMLAAGMMLVSDRHLPVIADRSTKKLMSIHTSEMTSTR